MLGLDKGPYGLPGCATTIRQGNPMPVDDGVNVVAPAYRMITDLKDDVVWTSLPGGIDGSRFSRTYTRWLNEWLCGSYHRLSVPGDEELSSAKVETEK